jgi:hypothetical protein
MCWYIPQIKRDYKKTTPEFISSQHMSSDILFLSLEIWFKIRQKDWNSGRVCTHGMHIFHRDAADGAYTSLQVGKDNATGNATY